MLIPGPLPHRSRFLEYETATGIGSANVNNNPTSESTQRKRRLDKSDILIPRAATQMFVASIIAFQPFDGMRATPPNLPKYMIVKVLFCRSQAQKTSPRKDRACCRNVTEMRRN
jgi:hypothetical protein